MKRQREKNLEKLQAKRAKFQNMEDEEDKVNLDIKQLKYELNGLIGINRFPFEVMNLILKHLEVADLIQCELVCLRWNAFVKAFEETELVISELKEKRPRKWKFLEKVCSRESTIIRSDLTFNNLENSFLLGLKRLKIINHRLACRQSMKFDQIPLLKDLCFINKLVNLETLEIKSIDFENEASLKLPNLRCLAVSNLGSKLKLETPELTSYRGKDLELIEFVFEEKLTHLCVNKCHSSLKQLNNLEYLGIKNDGFSTKTGQTSYESQASDEGQTSDESQASDEGQFSNDNQLLSTDQLLDNLPNLREFSIRPKFNQLNPKTYNLAKSIALKILKQKKRLKRDDFELIFFGVQLDDAQQLADFEYTFYDDDDNLVELHIMNYWALCLKELRWMKRVNFSELLKCVNDELIYEIYEQDHDEFVANIPPDFYEKFNRTEEAVIDYRISNKQIDALKNFKNLNSLVVQDESSWPVHCTTLFDGFQEILEIVAEALPQIWSLKLTDLYDAEMDDLDFVFEFKNLKKLLTRCWYSEDFLTRLFDYFNVFEVSFVANGIPLSVIRRIKNSKLEIWCKKRNHWEFHRELSNMNEVHEEIRLSLAD